MSCATSQNLSILATTGKRSDQSSGKRRPSSARFSSPPSTCSPTFTPSSRGPCPRNALSHRTKHIQFRQACCRVATPLTILSTNLSTGIHASQTMGLSFFPLPAMDRPGSRIKHLRWANEFLGNSYLRPIPASAFEGFQSLSLCLTHSKSSNKTNWASCRRLVLRPLRPCSASRSMSSMPVPPIPSRSGAAVPRS